MYINHKLKFTKLGKIHIYFYFILKYFIDYKITWWLWAS